MATSSRDNFRGRQSLTGVGRGLLRERMGAGARGIGGPGRGVPAGAQQRGVPAQPRRQRAHQRRLPGRPVRPHPCPAPRARRHRRACQSRVPLTTSHSLPLCILAVGHACGCPDHLGTRTSDMTAFLDRRSTGTQTWAAAIDLLHMRLDILMSSAAEGPF